jgi:hypothetical protein
MVDERISRRRGPNLTGGVRRLIGKIYDSDHSQTAETIMGEVHKQLIMDKKQLRPGWPGLSAIQKELTKIRLEDKNIRPEDRPWSVSNPENPPIPSDALPTVLKVMILFSRTRRSTFTIRQAKWVVLLYRTIKKIKSLTNAAEIYAADERVTELTGIEEDVLIKNATLYSAMTGNSVIISHPTSKEPLEITHEEDPEFNDGSQVGSPNPDVNCPYVIEVKESMKSEDI